MKIRKGDRVVVLSGKDRGREGNVVFAYPDKGRVIVDGANVAKKHQKARKANEQGGIIDFPAPINASNVMLLDPKSDAPTRTRRRIDTDGTKERLSVKSGEAIPRAR